MPPETAMEKTPKQVEELEQSGVVTIWGS